MCELAEAHLTPFTPILNRAFMDLNEEYRSTLTMVFYVKKLRRNTYIHKKKNSDEFKVPKPSNYLNYFHKKQSRMQHPPQQLPRLNLDMSSMSNNSERPRNLNNQISHLSPGLDWNVYNSYAAYRINSNMGIAISSPKATTTRQGFYGETYKMIGSQGNPIPTLQRQGSHNSIFQQTGMSLSSSPKWTMVETPPDSARSLERPVLRGSLFQQNEMAMPFSPNAGMISTPRDSPRDNYPPYDKPNYPIQYHHRRCTSNSLVNTPNTTFYPPSLPPVLRKPGLQESFSANNSPSHSPTNSPVMKSSYFARLERLERMMDQQNQQIEKLARNAQLDHIDEEKLRNLEDPSLKKVKSTNHPNYEESSPLISNDSFSSQSVDIKARRRSINRSNTYHVAPPSLMPQRTNNSRSNAHHFNPPFLVNQPSNFNTTQYSNNSLYPTHQKIQNVNNESLKYLQEPMSASIKSSTKNTVNEMSPLEPQRTSSTSYQNEDDASSEADSEEHNGLKDLNPESQLKALLWSVVYTRLLFNDVDKKIQERKKSVNHLKAKNVQSLRDQTLEFIKKSCLPALKKLYKQSKSLVLLNEDKEVDQEIPLKVLQKRFTLIITYLAGILEALKNGITEEKFPKDAVSFFVSISSDFAIVPNRFLTFFECSCLEFTYYGTLKNMSPIRVKMLIGMFTLVKGLVYVFLNQPWTYLSNVKDNEELANNLRSCSSVLYHIIMNWFKEKLHPNKHNQNFINPEFRVKPVKYPQAAFVFDGNSLFDVKYRACIDDGSKPPQDILEKEVITGLYHKSSLADCFNIQHDGVNKIKGLVEECLEKLYSLVQEAQENKEKNLDEEQ